MVGTVICPPTIGIVNDPFPTFMPPSGVTVMPRESRKAVIVFDGVTVACPPTTRSVFGLAWAGTATMSAHITAASPHTSLFDIDDSLDGMTGRPTGLETPGGAYAPPSP